MRDGKGNGMGGKKWLSCALVAAMAAALAGCGGSSETTTYIMADVQEGDHPTAIACDDFAEMVYKETDGRIKIEVYHGDVLGDETAQVKQVTIGGIDFVRASAPLAEYEDRLNAFKELYLFEDEDQLWDALNGPVGDELLNSEKFTENNIVGLCWFSGGGRNYYNSQHEITSPDDLKGMTMRVNTDPMMKQVELCGGNPVNIAYNDVYTSIKEGVIDGAENNWPSYISTGHYEVAKYITLDHHAYIPEMIIASKSALDGMSEEDREIVKECAKKISAQQIQAFQDYDAEAIELAKESGCTVTELTSEQLEVFREQAKGINEEVYGQYDDFVERLLSGQ